MLLRRSLLISRRNTLILLFPVNRYCSIPTTPLLDININHHSTTSTPFATLCKQKQQPISVQKKILKSPINTMTKQPNVFYFSSSKANKKTMSIRLFDGDDKDNKSNSFDIDKTLLLSSDTQSEEALFEITSKIVQQLASKSNDQQLLALLTFSSKEPEETKRMAKCLVKILTERGCHAFLKELTPKEEESFTGSQTLDAVLPFRSQLCFVDFNFVSTSNQKQQRHQHQNSDPQENSSKSSTSDGSVSLSFSFEDFSSTSLRSNNEISTATIQEIHGSASEVASKFLYQVIYPKFFLSSSSSSPSFAATAIYLCPSPASDTKLVKNLILTMNRRLLLLLLDSSNSVIQLLDFQTDLQQEIGDLNLTKGYLLNAFKNSKDRVATLSNAVHDLVLKNKSKYHFELGLGMRLAFGKMLSSKHDEATLFNKKSSTESENEISETDLILAPETAAASGASVVVVESKHTSNSETTKVMQLPIAEKALIDKQLKQRIDLVYHNKDRKSKNEQLVQTHLTKFIVMIYESTRHKVYKREANVTAPENHITSLSFLDYNKNYLPPPSSSSQKFSKKGEAMLPNLDGYDVLVIHGSKEAMLLLNYSEDTELRRFLQRGGRIWCSAVADYCLHGFYQPDHKYPEHVTLPHLALRYCGDQMTSKILKADSCNSLSFSYRDYLPQPQGEEQETTIVVDHFTACQVLAEIFKAQVEKAKSQGQVISLLSRMDAVLMHTEIEKNGIFIRVPGLMNNTFITTNSRDNSNSNQKDQQQQHTDVMDADLLINLHLIAISAKLLSKPFRTETILFTNLSKSEEVFNRKTKKYENNPVKYVMDLAKTSRCKCFIVAVDSKEIRCYDVESKNPFSFQLSAQSTESAFQEFLKFIRLLPQFRERIVFIAENLATAMILQNFFNEQTKLRSSFKYPYFRAVFVDLEKLCENSSSSRSPMSRKSDRKHGPARQEAEIVTLFKNKVCLPLKVEPIQMTLRTLLGKVVHSICSPLAQNGSCIVNQLGRHVKIPRNKNIVTSNSSSINNDDLDPEGKSNEKKTETGPPTAEQEKHLAKWITFPPSRNSNIFVDNDTNQNTAKEYTVHVETDHCIHQEIRLCGTSTGRTTSRLPNCQIIPRIEQHPIDSSPINIVRKSIVSRFGDKNGWIVEVDFKQLEIGVLALLSQDEQMVADLKNGVDFHLKRCTVLDSNSTYESLRTKYLAGDRKVKELRNKAKQISFQKMYGAGVGALVKSTGLSIDMVHKMMEAEAELFPDVARLPFLVRDLCLRNDNPALQPEKYRTLELPTGARVAIETSAVERMLPIVKNYPVQSYAAELMSIALGALYRQIVLARDFVSKQQPQQFHVINFVHDSIWFDCHDSIVCEFTEKACDILSTCIQQTLAQEFPSVPANVSFGVSASIGKNLAEMEDFDDWKKNKNN